VLKLFALMTPYVVTYALPIALLVAVLISLGRLSSDNEIIAIRTSGINILHLIAPLFVLGVILSLALIIFNDRAASYAHFAYRKTLKEIGIKNPTAAFEEGVFINSFQKYVLFIYRVDQKKNRLYNIRIYEPQGENKPTRTIIAKSGEFITNPETNTVKLKLVEGTSDEPDPENPTNFYKLNFKTYFMNLNLDKAQDKHRVVEKKPKEMNIQELRHQISALEKDNIDTTPLIVEMQKKLTLSVSALIFVLIGSAVAIITRRREKSINIGLAMLVIVIYYPLSIGAEALAIEGFLPALAAMWIPNVLFAIVGALLVYRICAS
jgi:lipopolysaccharide export system permease protein